LVELGELRPEFVKFHASRIRSHHQDRFNRWLKFLCGVIRDLFGECIADGSDTEEERRALLDFGCDLMVSRRPYTIEPTIER
jgi:EAL domain-containing protein (putative c-di-GMP-specific phosphodiesterase class I)